MSILCDYDIKGYVNKGQLVAGVPIEEVCVEPASVDVRLADGVFISNKTRGIVFCDRKPSPEIYTQADCEGDYFFIPPKTFALATTKETIKLPNNISAFVEGRSSIGRMGLFIQNAGWIDPGFEGQITLELFNATENTLAIKLDMRICQIVFGIMSGTSEGYKGKYHKQMGTTFSKIYKDFEKAIV